MCVRYSKVGKRGRSSLSGIYRQAAASRHGTSTTSAKPPLCPRDDFHHCIQSHRAPLIRLSVLQQCRTRAQQVSIPRCPAFPASPADIHTHSSRSRCLALRKPTHIISAEYPDNPRASPSTNSYHAELASADPRPARTPPDICTRTSSQESLAP